MSQRLLLCLLTLLLLGIAPGQRAVGQPSQATTTSPYYPLKIGNTWHYRAGTQKIVVRVAAQEKVGDVLCARVEATDKGTTRLEFIGVQADGLYRHKIASAEIKPALCIFKLPPQKGANWNVDSEVDGVKIKGAFVSDEAEVTVPAGKYKAVSVTSKDLTLGARKMTLTYWFVKDVGIVKHQMEIAGAEIILELEKFESAP